MRTSCKRTAFGFAIVAMLLRSLIPAGWMPSADASLSLMLCPGDLPARPAGVTAARPGMAAMADMASAKAPADQAKHAHDDGTFCPFGAAAPLSSPSAEIIVLLPADIAVHVVRSADRDGLASGRVHRPNAARAPPGLA